MVRRLLLLAALAALACGDGGGLPSEVVGPAPSYEDPEFASTLELLESIERGTFAERVGLADQLAELEAETLPQPVEIEFVSGTQVPADQQPELAELARELASRPNLRVDLVGCSDPSGPASVNLRISQRRAESVAARLRDLGVAAAQLGEVVGRGEECEVQRRAVNAIPAFREDDGGGA